jgi:hypothetical protein
VLYPVAWNPEAVKSNCWVSMLKRAMLPDVALGKSV